MYVKFLITEISCPEYIWKDAVVTRLKQTVHSTYPHKLLTHLSMVLITHSWLPNFRMSPPAQWEQGKGPGSHHSKEHF